MKKVLLFFVSALFALTSFGQTPTTVNALRFAPGTDTASIKTSAINGTVFFNTVTQKLRVKQGGVWVNLGAGSGGGGSVADVFGRIGSIVAQSGDYTFSQIGSKPTTLSGYGITDATSNTLSAGHLLVGNVSNIATDIALNGDASLSSSGTITVSKVNGTSITGSSILKGNGSGGFNNATGGIDYEVPLTFSTGLTRSTNTITVNTSQNISILSNLTTNGYVKTGSGTGALNISTAIPESDVTNLTSDLALKAPLASPIFTGAPLLPTGTTATTQSAGDNSTKLATTAYTDRIIADLSTPSTSSGTITLDLNSQYSRRFIGSASFSSGKTMALSNSTNAFVFDFTFTITNVAATLTFPSGWGMADLNWVSSTGIWTPPSTGTYEMSGLYNGTNWNIKISSAFTYH